MNLPLTIWGLPVKCSEFGESITTRLYHKIEEKFETKYSFLNLTDVCSVMGTFSEIIS